MDLFGVLFHRLDRNGVAVTSNKAPHIRLFTPDEHQISILCRVKMPKAFSNVFVLERARLSIDCLPKLHVCPFLVTKEVSYEIDHEFLGYGS